MMTMAVTIENERNKNLNKTTIRNQIDILNISEGFFQSEILFALLRLNIFERIGGKGKTLDKLAKELDAEPETLARLLNAAVILDLLKTQDGLIYYLTPMSLSVLLPSAEENYLGNWIRNLEYFRTVLLKLDEAVVKSKPVVDPTSHLGSNEKCTREFIFAMHNYAALRGKELAQYLDINICKSLLDLGCGPGTYAFHLGARNPDLQIYLIDLHDVLKIAREIQKKYPLKNQVHYIPANIVYDEIPGSYDIILISNTLHMIGEEASRDLINRLYKSVNPGGSLVIQAQFLYDTRLGPRWPILLDLIQLCLTSKGRNHSVRETQQWLMEAGFIDIEYCSMGAFNTNSFLRGYKRK